uniref:Uncharacterized protein n=1 Tax=Mucochytrium quahogii TaxID=96639 RepID=A0A7S2SDU8_9STRA|mmetsp:Transcript_10987/g.17999  ORF Transcript_10987/g.17999 Transcript_10987/m.17999 type:complete len:322 (+) Transcript_10987:207-1172(+)
MSDSISGPQLKRQRTEEKDDMISERKSCDSDVASSPERVKGKIIEEAKNVSSSHKTNGEVVSPLKKVQEIVAVVKDADLGPALKIGEGTKIQVKWSIAEGEEDEDVWWGGEILKSTGEKHMLTDPENNNERVKVPVYSIKYEPLLPDFPESSVSKVCFTDRHELYDIETDSNQCWRHMGSKWTEEDEVKNIDKNIVLDAALKISEEDMVTMQDILKTNNLPSGNAEDPTFVVPQENLEGTAETLVNSIIGNVLQTHGRNINQLPASIQQQITNDVIRVKKRMIAKIVKCFQEKRDLDAVAANEIVQEMGDEIKAVRARRGY